MPTFLSENCSDLSAARVTGLEQEIVGRPPYDAEVLAGKLSEAPYFFPER